MSPPPILRFIRDRALLQVSALEATARRRDGRRISLLLTVEASPESWHRIAAERWFYLSAADSEPEGINVSRTVELDLALDPLLWDAVPAEAWNSERFVDWIACRREADPLLRASAWCAWRVKQPRPGAEGLLKLGATTPWARPMTAAADATIRRELAGALEALGWHAEAIDPRTFAIDCDGRQLAWVALLEADGENRQLTIQSVLPSPIPAARREAVVRRIDELHRQGLPGQLILTEEDGILIHRASLAAGQTPLTASGLRDRWGPQAQAIEEAFLRTLEVAAE